MYEELQKRAKRGGEYGPNGEWYKGGAWIATTDHPKFFQVVTYGNQLHDAHVTAYHQVQYQNWLDSRVAKFSKYTNEANDVAILPNGSNEGTKEQEKGDL